MWCPTAVANGFRAGVICFGLAASQAALALPYDFQQPHTHNEIDRSRYVDTDWSRMKDGWIHAHTKASNGWRFDPLHGTAIFEFRDENNKKLKVVYQPVWCQASLGGHGAERWFDLDIYVGDVWPATAQIVMGSTYDIHTGYMPPFPPTVPIPLPPWGAVSNAYR